MASVVESPIDIFARNLFRIVYNIEGDTIDESEFQQFTEIIHQISHEKHVQFVQSTGSGLTQAENRKQFGQKSKDNGTAWSSLDPTLKAQWNALALRVPAAKEGGRVTGWDVFRIFKQVLPDMSGTGMIARPKK